MTVKRRYINNFDKLLENELNNLIDAVNRKDAEIAELKEKLDKAIKDIEAIKAGAGLGS